MAGFIQFTEKDGSSFQNMAFDEAMLDYAATGKASSRWYGWTEISGSFGYSQRWIEVTAKPGIKGCTYVRRITGGGIVDHRYDQTYALALPLDNALTQLRAVELYKVLHESIAKSLRAHGIRAKLQSCERNCSYGLGMPTQSPASVCFEKAEPFDVILEDTGKKLAGAAMKRDRRGLLVQGSLDGRLESAPGWVELKVAILHGIASSAGLENVITLPVSELWPMAGRHLEKYASERWNRRR